MLFLLIFWSNGSRPGQRPPHPWGTSGNVWKHVWLPQLEKGWAEVKGAAKHPIRHRKAPHHKEWPSPHVKAEMETSCFRQCVLSCRVNVPHVRSGQDACPGQGVRFGTSLCSRWCGHGWSIEYQRLCRSHAVFNVPILCSPSQEPVPKAHSQWSSWLHPPSNGSYTSTDPRNQLSLSDDLRICHPVSGALESLCWKLGASNQFWESDTKPEWGFRIAVCLVHVYTDTEGSEWGTERRRGRRRAGGRECLKTGKSKSCTDIRTAQIIQNKMQSVYLGSWHKIYSIYLK